MAIKKIVENKIVISSSESVSVCVLKTRFNRGKINNEEHLQQSKMKGKLSKDFDKRYTLLTIK